MGYVHTMQRHSDLKKDEIMPFPATGKKLEILILSEVKEKDKPRASLPVESKCGCKQTSLQKRNSPTDSEKKLMVTKTEAEGQGVISWFRSIYTP